MSQISGWEKRQDLEGEYLYSASEEPAEMVWQPTTITPTKDNQALLYITEQTPYWAEDGSELKYRVGLCAGAEHYFETKEEARKSAVEWMRRVSKMNLPQEHYVFSDSIFFPPQREGSSTKPTITFSSTNTKGLIFLKEKDDGSYYVSDSDSRLYETLDTFEQALEYVKSEMNQRNIAQGDTK